jgi:thiol-disulfide isomerase/thioredoxin
MRHLFAIFAIALYLSLGANAIAQKLDVLPLPSKADAAKATDGTNMGQRYPDFMMMDPGGKDIKLSDLRGKLVVLHFWGAWCPPCVREMPHLKRLYEQVSSKTDQIVFAFVQINETLERSKAWAKQNGHEIPIFGTYNNGRSTNVWIDAQRSANVKTYLGVSIFPSTILLDKHGIVVAWQGGSRHDWAELSDQVIALAKEAAAK